MALGLDGVTSWRVEARLAEQQQEKSRVVVDDLLGANGGNLMIPELMGRRRGSKRELEGGDRVLFKKEVG